MSLFIPSIKTTYTSKACSDTKSTPIVSAGMELL